MAKSFWRNVVLIALGHVALIVGLIRWSVAARAPSNPDSVMWLGAAEDLSTGGSAKQESLSPKQPATATESSESEQDEAANEKPVVTTAKSEIELPLATPKPTATPTPAPKPSNTPALRAKTIPIPTPQSTPKKTLSAKASPKLLAKTKPSPTKARATSEKKEKITLAKNDSASQSGTKKSGSINKDGSGSGSSPSEFGWYGNMLHDRFYRAWIQPTTSVAAGTKISTLVKLRIEKDGRVSKFEIIKPSGNGAVNESVRLVAKQVTQVDPPPTGLFKGDHYDVRINFELNTEAKTGN